MAETRLSEESLHEGGRVKNVLQRLEQQPPALVKGAIYYCVIFYGTFVKGAIYYRFLKYLREGSYILLCILRYFCEGSLISEENGFWLAGWLVLVGFNAILLSLGKHKSREQRVLAKVSAKGSVLIPDAFGPNRDFW